MLATLNLQLITTDLGGETPSLQAFSPEDAAAHVGGFADLLNLRVNNLQQQPVLDGQILPPDGNLLPEPEIEITIDDLPVTDPTAAMAPEIGALLAPESNEINGLPESDPAKIATPGTVDPVITTIPPLVIPGPVTPPVAMEPLAEAAATDASAARDAARQLRDVLLDSRQQSRAELASQQIEARAAGSSERLIVPVPPGAVADRQQTPPRPIAESAVGDNDINRLFDTAGRQTAVPVAAPVLERLAEVMRSRVRPGQHVTAATTHSTPAGFQPLPTTNSLADTSFASTLQQQASDLIRTPVSEPAWGDRMGQRVVMLAANQLKTAEIRLTPAELGPVRVKVSIEDGAANVTFQAAHAVTREALEQALPRLREMLAENGLTLGQADVGDQGVAQGNGDSDSDSAAAGLATDDTGGHGDETDLVERQRTLASDSLVDTFA